MRSVAFMTRAADPFGRRTTESAANWHRWNFVRALKHAGVNVEFPQGLKALPSSSGEGSTTNRSNSRTRGGSTICEFTEASELYRPYLMSIAFENSYLDELVSEKIVNSFYAGTIPIYWGSPSVFKYFNRKAFVYAEDFPSLWALAEHVADIMRNCTLQQQYLREPPTTEAQLRQLMWWRRDQVAQQVLPHPPCGH
eukprot:Hpha_TRINITY_DN19350_c0_g1::TRINITY_DN19350_c0_g1_i1::g.81271::m.81271